MTQEEMERLTQEASTTSEKIRLLYDAGVPKAEISRFVGRRYQQIYNVIKDYERRKGAQGADSPAAAPVAEAIRLTLGRNGSLRLPTEWLQSEGLNQGDAIICRVEGRGLLLMSRTAAADMLRDLARRHMPGEAALVDALLTGVTEQDT